MRLIEDEQVCTPGADGVCVGHSALAMHVLDRNSDVRGAERTKSATSCFTPCVRVRLGVMAHCAKQKPHRCLCAGGVRVQQRDRPQHAAQVRGIYVHIMGTASVSCVHDSQALTAFDGARRLAARAFHFPRITAIADMLSQQLVRCVATRASFWAPRHHCARVQG